MHTASARARRMGRTLIELVIAMAIGLLIVIALSSLFLASSQASRVAQQVSSVEQAGQLALLMIGDLLKPAGYGEIVGSDFTGDGQTLMDGVHLRGCTGRQFDAPLPAYVAPPGSPIRPDLTCTRAIAGDSLYVRYQAGPAAAEMLPTEAGRITMRDCLSQSAYQHEVLATPGRPGSGRTRPMAFSVLRLDAVNRTLDCRGNGGTTYQALARDVVEFRLFYRFDDAAYGAAKSGITHAAPMGASVRDAAFINGQSGPVDPWNYVVAVMACLTIQTSESGTGSASTSEAPRCPDDAAEAETGVALTTTVPDGRIRRSFSGVFTIRSRATASPSITL
jgi:Tfp pilus assembly protein PilW